MSMVSTNRTIFQSGFTANKNKRRSISLLFWAIAGILLILVLGIVVLILGTVVYKGLPGLTLTTLMTDTSGIAGGLENAILGTLVLIVASVVLSGVIGVLGGTYIAVFARPGVASVLRFATEVLAGVPSIIIGYFGYTVMVVQWGFGYSLLAAAISLGVLTLPYIVRTTEASLRQVPKTLYEGGLALGLTQEATLRKVMFRPALPGIFTGLLLAISIGLGETAPLLFTAGWSNFNPTLTLVHNPIAYLTYVVWTYSQEPYHAAHQLAYTAGLILVLLLLILNIGVRFLQRGSSQS